MEEIAILEPPLEPIFLLTHLGKLGAQLHLNDCREVGVQVCSVMIVERSVFSMQFPARVHMRVEARCSHSPWSLCANYALHTSHFTLRTQLSHSLTFSVVAMRARSSRRLATVFLS